MRTRPLLLFLTLAALVVSGCGEADSARDEVEQRVDEVRAELREQRDRVRDRIEEVLGQIERAIPEARRTDPTVRSRGSNEPETIDEFMTRVLKNIDAYWTTTLREAGVEEPRVRYHWIAPRLLPVRTACGAAGQSAALYCPGDDTIYVAQRFAADLYSGVLRGLPGQSAGYGRAAGDFAVAYVLAHEYAHNLQEEWGVFQGYEGPTARPLELQADCLAGTWANSVYEQGLLAEDDLAEVVNAALAVGDFDVGNAQHHGTPEERRDAVLRGFESGRPQDCAQYVPQV